MTKTFSDERFADLYLRLDSAGDVGDEVVVASDLTPDEARRAWDEITDQDSEMLLFVEFDGVRTFKVGWRYSV